MFSTIALCLLISADADIPALKALRTTFASKKGFEVSFAQEIKQEIFPEQKDRAEGNVQFVRPNRLKWVYNSPQKRVIEYQGGDLKIIEGGETQIIRDSGQINLQESFSFLWGQTDFKHFKVESQSTTTFRVTPRNPATAGFKSINVTVAKGLVEKAVVQNPLDGESILRFSSWKLLK
jgi:outer membrane lipoprotein-sorting protein